MLKVKGSWVLYKSKLFYEVPRVVALVKQYFQVPVGTFVENVSSMTDENVVLFSQALGVRPVLLDAKYFCHCRRPRFYWPSWTVVAQGEEKLKKLELWDEWIFPEMRTPSSVWLDEGSSWDPADAQELPTFTRPQRRNRPPYKPAGIATASQGAIDRWVADKYFVQVYNYEQPNMIKDKDGTLRLPLVKEKEVIMGFDQGYMSKSFGTKVGAGQLELLGGQMIGNTFNVYAVMMLLHECLRQHGGPAQRDAKQLVSIGGTSPEGWTKY